MDYVTRVKTVFRNRPDLIGVLFAEDQLRSDGSMKAPPDEMVKRLRGMSPGEQILIKAGMVMWSGEHCGLKMSDLSRLDRHNLAAVCDAMKAAWS